MKLLIIIITIIKNVLNRVTPLWEHCRGTLYSRSVKSSHECSYERVQRVTQQSEALSVQQHLSLWWKVIIMVQSKQMEADCSLHVKWRLETYGRPRLNVEGRDNEHCRVGGAIIFPWAGIRIGTKLITDFHAKQRRYCKIHNSGCLNLALRSIK